LIKTENKSILGIVLKGKREDNLSRKYYSSMDEETQLGLIRRAQKERIAVDPETGHVNIGAVISMLCKGYAAYDWDQPLIDHWKLTNDLIERGRHERT
jgi:hypothetical protein